MGESRVRRKMMCVDARSHAGMDGMGQVRRSRTCGMEWPSPPCHPPLKRSFPRSSVLHSFIPSLTHSLPPSFSLFLILFLSRMYPDLFLNGPFDKVPTAAGRRQAGRRAGGCALRYFGQTFSTRDLVVAFSGDVPPPSLPACRLSSSPSIPSPFESSTATSCITMGMANSRASGGGGEGREGKGGRHRERPRRTCGRAGRRPSGRPMQFLSLSLSLSLSLPLTHTVQFSSFFLTTNILSPLLSIHLIHLGSPPVRPFT